MCDAAGRATAQRLFALLEAAATSRHIRSVARASSSPWSRTSDRQVVKASAWPVAARTRVRYELEIDFDRVPGLIERFELRFPGEAVQRRRDARACRERRRTGHLGPIAGRLLDIRGDRNRRSRRSSLRLLQPAETRPKP